MSRCVNRGSLALCLVLAAVACGQVTVDPSAGEGPGDKSDAGPDGSEQDGQGGGETVSTPDAIPKDTGPACLTHYDCAEMKGKTPCNLPQCKKGECVFVGLPVGATCVDPLSSLGECERSRCDAKGTCAVMNAVDGQACGFGACGKKCQAGSCVPAQPSDYDDGDPCTNDYCHEGRKVVHDPITNLALKCDDGNKCTVDDACIKGKCQGAVMSCKDDHDCTFDTCDATEGCVHTPKDSACDDGDPCTADGCDLAAGCTVTGDATGACDDGNGCTGGDKCVGGKCAGTPDPKCGCAADADCVKYNKVCVGKYKCDKAKKVCVLDPATVVACDTKGDTACLKNICAPATGACAKTPVGDGSACDDGDKCTEKSACNNGMCLGTKTADCDDGNPCTDDGCTADKGCESKPGAGVCEDGDKCTGPDACQGGVCIGAMKVCSDGVQCTLDNCDIVTGDCKHVADAVGCDDGNACTADACDVKKGCAHKPDDTATCDDGDPCTADACKLGACASENKCECKANTDCDDKNPCTSDTCALGKCQYAVVSDGKACDTGNKCHKPGSGACLLGQCQGGQLIVCKAAACQTASCNQATGKCESLPKGDGTSCAADADGCTFDACKKGKCVNVGKVTCAGSAGPCTIGVCTSKGPSKHVCGVKPRPVNTVCKDGSYCTVGDHCDGKGKCVAGKPRVCPGSSTLGPCTAPFCDEAANQCTIKPKPSGTKCSDGKFCTQGDTCDGKGKCLSGKLMVCKGGSCLKGYCDEPGKQCKQAPIFGCCVGAQQCNDGQACTADACASGKCVHEPMSQCCNPVRWMASFEDGQLSGLLLKNTAGPGSGWQLAPKAKQTAGGTGALYYGNLTTNNFNFGKSAGSAITPPIKLPPGASTVQLEIYFDTEAGPNYDKIAMEVLIPGAKPVEIWTKGSTAIKTWTSVNVDVSKFSGETIRLRLRFETVDAINNQGMGVFVDNWRVLGACPL